jgi:hypothetical protein
VTTAMDLLGWFNGGEGGGDEVWEAVRDGG